MALDARAIFQALLAYLQVTPQGTEEQFKTDAVQAGLGTESAIVSFLTAWYQALLDSGIMDAATWTAVLGRLDAVGFERFKTITSNHFCCIYKAPEMAAASYQNLLDEIDTHLTDIAVKEVALDQAQAWVEENMPAGADKDVLLQVLYSGRTNDIISPKLEFNRTKDELLEKLG